MNLSTTLNQIAATFDDWAAESIAAHDPATAATESALAAHCRRIALNHRALAILSGDAGDDPTQIEVAR